MAWDFLQKLKSASFFKGKEGGLKARPKKGIATKAPKASFRKAPEEEKIDTSKTVRARALPQSEVASESLIAPHITEKASMLSESGTYVFKVPKIASKINLKSAVEKRYNVSVKSVRMINTPAKIRRRGNILGVKSGYKKALVSLEAGNSIDTF